MTRRRDWLALLLALLLAAALFGGRALWLAGKRPERYVRITVNGELYALEPLGEEREITIEQPNGTRNTVRIYEDGFSMLSSTCRNQLCVRQGTVTTQNYADRSLGTHILCLPNRVDVELVLSEDDDVSLSPDA